MSPCGLCSDYRRLVVSSLNPCHKAATHVTGPSCCCNSVPTPHHEPSVLTRRVEPATHIITCPTIAHRPTNTHSTIGFTVAIECVI